jgi:hypothetical protein
VGARLADRAGGRVGKKLRRARLDWQLATIDAQLRAWLESEQEDEREEPEEPEGAEGTEAQAEDEDWYDRLIRPGASVTLYKLFLAFDGQHLPWAGGLLDQAEWWIHDVNILAKRKANLRRQMKQGRAAQDRVEKVKQLMAQRKRGRR